MGSSRDRVPLRTTLMGSYGSAQSVARSKHRSPSKGPLGYISDFALAPVGPLSGDAPGERGPGPGRRSLWRCSAFARLARVRGAGRRDALQGDAKVRLIGGQNLLVAGEWAL